LLWFWDSIIELALLTERSGELGIQTIPSRVAPLPPELPVIATVILYNVFINVVLEFFFWTKINLNLFKAWQK